MLRPILFTLLWVATPALCSAQGLKLQPEADDPLRARVHLLTTGEEIGQGSRLLGAQVLGDIYLGSRGLRVSGGLMLGPGSVLASGLAPAQPGRLGVAHRRLLGGLQGEGSQSQPYLGMGYSRHGQDWGFSADLGVAVVGHANGVRLGSASAFAQSLDESLRRLQWTPMLQLGLSYRF